MLEFEQTLTLSLKPRVRQPEVAAGAWLLVGNDPAAWLDALVRLEANLDLCQGYVLPSSLKDRQPSGFLVVAGLSESVQHEGPSYRCLGERLWLPCDADLSPPLHESEIEGFIRHHAAVFHPGIGLIGFEESDRIGIAALLAPVRERSLSFSWAHPGVPVQDRLYAITAAPVPTVDLLLRDAGEEIGSQEASALPKAPGERPYSLGKRMKQRMLSALNKLSKKSSGGWKERLESWTEDRLERLRKDQERELNRLLHLLKSDPDEGLKFALPLSGGQAGGDPLKNSDKLAERSTDFRLDNVGRRQPGSPWVMDWQKHYELSREYREAANRELRLGRHRKSAYIYAELLKDYREAANVLRQGKHYREASVLYLKHLGDPLEGARCLREGGFLLEAIPIFERKKQHETAAELYADMGNTVEAERQYRLAVSRALAHGHTTKAATLLEQQLGNRDEAIALLQKSWPRSEDAVTCLAHELNLYERDKAGADLIRRMGEVSADHPPGRAVGLVETLLRVARQSCAAEVRQSAEQACFTVAGRWLGSPTFSESRTMLGLVRRLVPEDRLLVRDTARFLQQSEDEAKARSQRRANQSVEAPVVLLDVHPMPTWVTWQRLEPRGRSGFFAFGVAAGGLTLMRMRWDGSFQTQMMPDATVGQSSSQCRLAVTDGALPEVVSILGMKQLPTTLLSPADAFASEVRVENPPWVKDRDFLALAYGGNGVAWILQRAQEEGMLVVSSYSAMGDLIATHTIRLPVGALGQAVHAPLPMICAQEQLVFAYGRHLIRYYRDRVDGLEMAEVPNRLHYAPLGRLQLAASYDVGAEVFWGDGHWGRGCSLDLPVNDPYMTFTRTGDVLSLSRDRLDWLGYQRGSFVPMHAEDLSGFGDPLGIFPTETPNVYAMVSQREVRMIKVTPWQLGK